MAFGQMNLGRGFSEMGASGGPHGIRPAFSKLISDYAAGYGSIGFIGDSLFAGWGAGSTSSNGKNSNGAYALSTPSIIRSYLAGHGLNIIDGSFPPDNAVNAGVGGATSTALLQAYDPRRVPNTGWVINAVGLAAGGYMPQGNTATTGQPWNLVPSETFDNIDVFAWRQASGASDISVSVDGGSVLATIPCTAASSILKQTISVSRGTHTINMIRATSGSAFWAFARVRDSLSKQIACYNLGMVGAKVSDWLVTTNPFSPTSMLAQLACSLWVIQLGANDANASVSAATYQTNLQTLITSCKAAGGDVLLVVPTPASGGYNIPQGYIDAIYALCTSNNLQPPVDLNALFVSYVVSQAYYFDTVHLIASGYQRCGQAIGGAIVR